LTIRGHVTGLLGSGPRHREFYDLFRRGGDNAELVTRRLDQLMQRWPDDGPALRHEIRELEHEGDRVTHQLMRHLQTRAQTPLPARDAHELASRLDDVVDLAEEVADFMALYRIEAPTDQGIALAGIFRAAGAELGDALRSLDDLRRIRPHLLEIDRLEDDGDRIEREALATLFQGGIDPMVVIRWKDIYERLEAGIDACDSLAKVLEGIVVKQV
jgi:predicted phosphate transport protein (TIGR00153 family)